MPVRKRYATQRMVKGTRALNPRQQRQVKILIARQQELDYYDNGVNASSIGVLATVQGGLSTPIQGDSDGERVGDKIQLKAFKFRFHLIGGDATNNVRVILFRWHQDNNVASPAAADVLQNPTGFPVTSAVNHDRIKAGILHIMYDKTFALSNSTSGGGTPSCLSREVNIYGKKLGRKGIEFNNAAITGNNHIYALFQSDSNAAPNPSITWYSRLTYTDA